MNETFDYKKRCEELTVKCLKLDLALERERKDNRWLRQVIALALGQNASPLVIREEELAHAPEIVLDENLANEMIIRIRRTKR